MNPIDQAWILLKYQMHEGDEKHFDYDYSAPITPENWDSETFDDWHEHWNARDKGAFSRHDFNEDEYGRKLLRNPDGGVIGPELSMDEHTANRKLRKDISREALRRMSEFRDSQEEKGLDPHRPEGQAHLDALYEALRYGETMEDIPTWEGE